MYFWVKDQTGCKIHNWEVWSNLIELIWGVRFVARPFTIPLGWIQILQIWGQYGPQDRKRPRTTDFVEVDDAVHKWYCLAR